MYVAKFGSVLSIVGLVAAVSTAGVGCASQSPRERAAGTTTTTKDPQPDDFPCSVCLVNVNGRVTGQWQETDCRTDPSATSGAGPAVAYPVHDPTVEVTEGAQKGMQFAVDVGGQEQEAGAALDGTLKEDAEPANWTAAILWVTDSAGNQCYSVLGFER